MSIALLRKRGFRHRFQDDMESFYYVLLYSSVLWLPREEEEGFEKLVSEYFNEYLVGDGIATGGSFKAVNIFTGFFRNIWQFDNVLMQKYLDDILDLQRPFEDQPSWIPQALYTVMKSMDEEDLPLDDRMDHYRLKRNKFGPRRRHTHRRTTAHVKPAPSPIAKSPQDVPVDFEAPGKRGVNEAQLKERTESTKRPCRISIDKIEE